MTQACSHHSGIAVAVGFLCSAQPLLLNPGHADGPYCRMQEMTTLASPYQDMAPNAIITGLMVRPCI